MSARLPVVGYGRVSMEEQAREGVSLRDQDHKLRLHAELFNLDLVEIILDEGESGKNLDRPGIQRVLELLDSGVAQGLAVVKLDRMTRSLTDWCGLANRYFKEKVKTPRKLFSVMESIDTTTANGRLMLNFFIMIAEWEREVISERTTGGLRDKIRNNERCGKVRYGYRLDLEGPLNKRGNPRNLLEVPEEQAAIMLMKQIRAEGRSLQAIADTLHAQGIVTREGNAHWTTATIHKILKRAV